MLAAMRIGRKNGVFIYSVAHIDIHGPVLFKIRGVGKVVKRGEHGAVFPVVPVKHGDGIRKVPLVIALRKYAAAGIIAAVNGMI